MNESEDRIYTTLCALFAVLIVMGNLIYQKFVFLPVLPFYTFELSVGAILYPQRWSPSVGPDCSIIKV